MSAAAPPPTALKRLTNCGIEVIWIRRAAMAPTTEPTSRPAMSTTVAVAVMTWSWASSTMVVTNASTMPPAETWLPRRAEAGEFIRCRPATKQTAATRYVAWMTVSKSLTARSPWAPARRAAPF